MKKAIQSSTKKQNRTVRAPKKISPKKSEEIMIDDLEEQEIDEDIDMNPIEPVRASNRRGLLLVLGIVLVLGLAGYRYRQFLVPATVNGKPIYVWQYLGALHKQYGADQLNAMTTEEVIRQAVASANVSVPSEEVTAEIDRIDKEASASGGIAAILTAQGISRAELEDRIELQLAVKKLLADKIKVEEKEIDETYTKNKDFYKGIAEADAKNTIKMQLEDQKFQQEAGNWLQEQQKNAKVEIKLQ